MDNSRFLRALPSRDPEPLVPEPAAGPRAPIRVVVVSRQRIVRDALATMLSLQDSIFVVGSADTSKSALNLTQRLKPNVVVSSDALNPDDVRNLAEIDSDAGSVRVVMPMSPGNLPWTHAPLANGGSVFLDTDATGNELIASIRSITRMNNDMATFVSQRMLDQVGRVNEQATLSEQIALSPRQREILLCVAKGLSNRQIGSRLGLTEGTVKRHLANVYAKLDVRSRTEAVRKALVYNLISAHQIASGLDPDEDVPVAIPLNGRLRTAHPPTATR